MRERRVRDASDEAWDLEQVVNLRQVRVGEGMAGEAAQEAAGRQGAGGEDGFCDGGGGKIVPEEDDAFLS